MAERNRSLAEQLVFVNESLVQKYYFRFEYYGWATFVATDDGDLLINSDWGKWCYTWGGGPSSWGTPTFVEFLTRRTDASYIAEKLGYQIETTCLYVEFTRNKMLAKVIEQRRSKKLSKHRARLAWEEVFGFCDLLQDDSDHAIYRGQSRIIRSMFKDIHEYMVYGPTPSFAFLKDQLLPVFLSHLRGELYVKQ